MVKPAHQPTANPSIPIPLYVAHISAHLILLHVIIHWATSPSCLCLIFLSWAPPPSCWNCPAPLLLHRPLKETWSLKSAKRSTSEALKRPSVQLMVTETAPRRRARRPGPDGGRGEMSRGSEGEPDPYKGGIIAFLFFFHLGLFFTMEGVKMTQHTWLLDEMGNQRKGDLG